MLQITECTLPKIGYGKVQNISKIENQSAQKKRKKTLTSVTMIWQGNFN